MPLDGRAPDEADPAGDDVAASRVLLGPTSERDRLERAVRLEEANGRAVDPQQAEHAIGDPFAHGGQVEGLVDEMSDPRQLPGARAGSF